MCIQHLRSLQQRRVDVGGFNGREGNKCVIFAVLFCFRTTLEKVSEDLTSIIFNVLCKSFGAFHICSAGPNKFSLPVKYVAVECDQTEEVIFCQVIQDVDQCDAGLDKLKRLFTCRAQKMLLLFFYVYVLKSHN